MWQALRRRVHSPARCPNWAQCSAPSSWYRANRGDNRNFRDGRWWTYNSIKALETVFPWWNAKQVRRIAASCREQGALIVGEFNKDRRDRALWYTPSDDLLALYGLTSETGTCICPKGQL